MYISGVSDPLSTGGSIVMAFEHDHGNLVGDPVTYFKPMK